MANSQQCPSMEQLKQLAVGLLPDPPAISLEEHLLECEACVQQTAQLQHDDTLLSAIKQAAKAQTERSPEEMARLERLMTSLSGLRGEQSDATLAEETSPKHGAANTSSDQLTRELSAAWRPAEAADEIGRLGSYRILKLVGAGGMGGVFLAEDMQLQRRVALKMMRRRAAADPGAAERFLREARAVAALRHEHIITVYQVGEEAGVPFLAMEYLEGESLDDRLKREETLPVGDVLRIGGEIAEGLSAAHAKGLIHRDIKPANVWLECSPVAPRQESRIGTEDVISLSVSGAIDADSTSGFPIAERQGYVHVKLLDFGLARPAEDDTQLTASGMIVGTPSYMAPEQANGESIDARADLFSLGVVLYRMTTGQLPFPGKTMMEILKALATVTPAAPKSINPNVPTELSDLVMQLLAKERNARPASARDVSRRLDALARPELATERKETGRSAHPPKRVALALLGCAAMLLFGVVIVKIKTKDGKETEVAINVPGEVSSVSTTVRDGGGAKAVAMNAVDANATKFITLAALDPNKIPESERFDWQPEELVAVIGEHRLRHWAGMGQIRFHPSGDFVVTTGEAAKLHLTKTLNSPLGALVGNVAQSISSHGFEFSRDGKWMYSANRIYSVNMDDAANPRIALAHTLHTNKPIYQTAVAIHDDRWVILAPDTTGELLIWDLAAKPARQIKTVKFEAKSWAFSLTLSPDGRRLAAPLSEDYRVRVWDIDWTNADDPVFTLRDQQVRGNWAVMSPDNSLMAAGGEGLTTIDLWDVSQTPLKLVQQIPQGGRRFAFSPDGKHLAVAGDLGFQIYAQTDAGWAKRHALSEGMGSVISLAWSPDQKTLVAGEHFGGVHVWDMSQEPPQRRNPSPPASNVMRVAISPDGRSLLTSGADSMTTAWNLEGEAPSRLEWEARGEGHLSSFSHDSQLAQTQGYGSDSIWNLKSNPPASVSDPISDHSIFSAAEPCLISFHGNRLFRRDWKLTQRGRFALSNERDLWTSPANSTVFTMFDALYSLQFGSQRFATRHGDPTVGNQTVNVWDLANAAKPLHELKHNLIFGHHNHSLTLSPDGNVLLAFSNQPGSIVWDLKETPPREYPLVLSPHVEDAFFTTDNELLFVADHAGVGIYDWAKNREVRRIKYPGTVRQIVPHPDGQHLITVNGNGTVYILRLPELASR